MKRKLLVPMMGLLVVGAGMVAATASGQAGEVAGRQAAGNAAATDRADLGEASRGCSEVSRFLANPKLAEAIAAARAEPRKAAEARANANAYLASSGVQVPANVMVRMEPSGGSAARTKVEIKISCCPLNIEIIITF